METIECIVKIYGEETNSWKDKLSGVGVFSFLTRELDSISNRIKNDAELNEGNGFIYIGLGSKETPDEIIDLYGEDRPDAYIGESADGMRRFVTHRRERPWISKFIVIRHSIFNSLDVRLFFERKLILELSNSGRYKVDNECLQKLKKAESSIVNSCSVDTIEQVYERATALIVRLVATVYPFRARSGKKISVENKVHIIRNSKNDKPFAFGEWKKDGGVTVLKHQSFCNEIESPPSPSPKTKKIYRSILDARNKLIDDGVLKKTVDGSLYPYVFEQDKYFAKLTSASQIILGKSSSGLETWTQTCSGKTIKELQEDTKGVKECHAISDSSKISDITFSSPTKKEEIQLDMQDLFSEFEDFK